MPISVASNPRIPGLAVPVRAIVTAALAARGRRVGEIAVVLTDDATIRDLNRRWRRIDRATDVLSFEYGASPDARSRSRGTRPRGSRAARDGQAGARVPGGPEPARTVPPVQGDLVISLDRMRAQSRRYRVTPGRELARLVIHGALHLAGLDHRAAAERARMRREERSVLRAHHAAVAALDRALRGG